jgi:transposase
MRSLRSRPWTAGHDYKRNGTSSLYAARDITSGKVIGSVRARHRAIEFKKFLTKIDAEVPAEFDLHVVLDNASTHKTPAVKRWLAAHPRFVLQFTPTSSSWLNLVERWFGELTARSSSAAPTARCANSWRHPLLDPDKERQPAPLRLDQDRRPDPRIHRPLLLATLVVVLAILADQKLNVCWAGVSDRRNCR